MSNEFEAWARRIRDSAKRTQPTQPDPKEYVIEIPGCEWLFVLSSTRERAIGWCERDGHVGVTAEEIRELERQHGRPVPVARLNEVATVKRALIGSRVTRGT